VRNPTWDRVVRTAAMAWLDAQNPTGTRMFRRAELRACTIEDVRVPLVDVQQGIWKPATMAAALSILTTYTPPGHTPPYQDGLGPDGLHRYKYRGQNPQEAANRWARAAFEQQVPVIWFVGAAPGAYVPLYPVWVIGEEPRNLQFVLALDDAQRLVVPGTVLDEDHRQYMERLTKQRVHQPVFRAQVLAAYEERCAICRLKYVTLLDAAHILPDGHPRGTPVVSNGLALCKIHHAAFDSHLLGARPDYVVEVRSDVQGAIDGPMLVHGLQEMHGTRLSVPRARDARPDPVRLEERYQLFVNAG
jgi:putative restriction endonuclease